IYDKDVENEPTFRELSEELFELFNPCDLGGFNSNRFDVPILIEEFLRLFKNFSLDNRNLIDVRNIFVMMEKRDLTSAYKYFCGKDLVNAHSALADVKATHEVFMAQLEKYEDLAQDIDQINIQTRNDLDQIDTANRLAMINGVPCFNFGKYKGISIAEVLKKDAGYYGWIQRSDFPLHTKQKLKEIKLSLQL
ncbi:MAG: 3'-5' exonuclease, partial [Bacteroidetes bacterium]|nr:3'-5' exonuclease [Bacteroidota bacterium]